MAKSLVALEHHNICLHHFFEVAVFEQRRGHAFDLIAALAASQIISVTEVFPFEPVTAMTVGGIFSLPRIFLFNFSAMAPGRLLPLPSHEPILHRSLQINMVIIIAPVFYSAKCSVISI
ncbi:MAG: hypothetical protein RSE36_02085 [Oscillospiraceae bacterium]